MTNMGVYLDRLRSEFDDITANIDAVLERAAAESRDLTDDEQSQIERDDQRRDQLQKAIDTQAALLDRTGKVHDRLSGLRSPAPPARTRPGEQPPAEFDLAREIGGDTPGHYAAVVHRAWVRRDRDAVDLLERATAHQVLADNPGLVPRPLVGPVVDRLRRRRPFINSLGPALDAPAPVFDRPLVSQHVDVDIQAAEKDLTASQKLKVGKVPVTLDTFAGHLNLSKQDIRWTQPSLLNVVYNSFGKVYAKRSDKKAAADFVAAITQTDTIATLDAAGIDEVIGAAGATIAGADDDMGEVNRVWMSRDVAVKFASLRNPTTGLRLFNIPLVGGVSGDLDGLPVSIAGRLPAGTLIVGDEDLVEWWEDMEGFLQVDEPDVLGQMVGYAGYGSICVVDAAGFVKIALP